MSHPILMGIELEGIYNKDSLRSKFGSGYGYRQSNGKIVSDSWMISSDSSLEARGTKFDNYEKAELIQLPRIGREGFFDSLQEFKKLFKPGKELKECVEFNKSCGCHVHFSTNRKIFDRCMFEHVGFLREQLEVNLKKKLSAPTVKNIMDHYNRSYSSKIEEEDFEKFVTGTCSDRREVNFVSEHKGKGIEWRAFNLRDISTWEEFDGAMEAMYETVEGFLNEVYNFNREYVVSINTKTIKSKAKYVGSAKFKIPKLTKFKK